MSRLAGLRTAVALLTSLPLGRRQGVESGEDPRWLNSAPLVGLGLAVLSAALLAALRGLSADRYQQLLASALVLGFLALVTRGIHLTGLAATADALGSVQARPAHAVERRSAPALGTFGAATLVLVLLIEAAALWQSVILERGTVSILTAVATGRVALLWGAREGVQAASATGLAADEGAPPAARLWDAAVGSVRPLIVVLASLLVIVACSAAGALDDHRGVSGAAHVAVASVVGLAAAIAFRRRTALRLAVVSRHVLAAMVEVATASTLVVMAFDLKGF